MNPAVNWHYKDGYMVLSFAELEDLSLEQWFKKNIDENSALKYEISETNQGYKTLIPNEAEIINYLNNDDRALQFIQDDANKRVVIVSSPNYSIGLEKIGYFQPHLILAITDTTTFQDK